MNRLVIIGNGFDLAHGLKTSYKDFINWYWDKVFVSIFDNNSNFIDSLCSIKFNIAIDQYFPRCIPLDKSAYMEYKKNHRITDLISWMRSSTNFEVKLEVLMNRIVKSIEEKDWSDIESDYYELLKENSNDIEKCKSLNEQLDFLREKLAEYLKTQTTTNKIQGFRDAINKDIDEEDVAISERQKMDRMIEKVDETLFLNFNYTNTIQNYTPNPQAIHLCKFNHIHGSLDNPEEMIFGYGDEMDKDFKDLENRNENELLENSKSIKYLETSHYRNLLNFIEGGPFQVYIMGHSCGNSDRTLLNTIFEHENCISIKPFCYINDNGEDNYSELTRNIYRNFTDKKLFRDRVVNKERCTTLEGKYLIKRKKQVEEEKQNK